MVWRRIDQAGIVPRVHPHQLRHSAADAWLSAGGSELGPRKKMGWPSPAMVARYAASQAMKNHRTFIVSRTWKGTYIQGSSSYTPISGSGAWVTFRSRTRGIVRVDTNGAADVSLRARFLRSSGPRRGPDRTGIRENGSQRESGSSLVQLTSWLGGSAASEKPDPENRGQENEHHLCRQWSCRADRSSEPESPDRRG